MDMNRLLRAGRAEPQHRFFPERIVAFRSLNAINELTRNGYGCTIRTRGDLTKLTLEGTGMALQHGVASQLFSTLRKENIHIWLITTSETRIEFCVDTEHAVRAADASPSVFRDRLPVFKTIRATHKTLPNGALFLPVRASRPPLCAFTALPRGSGGGCCRCAAQTDDGERAREHDQRDVVQPEDQRRYEKTAASRQAT